MADTLPNIVIPPMTVVDLYAQSGIAIGTKITVQMIADAEALLYAGSTLSSKPSDATGYMPMYGRKSYTNEAGDLGAFIWSDTGCTINIKVA